MNFSKIIRSRSRSSLMPQITIYTIWTKLITIVTYTLTFHFQSFRLILLIFDALLSKKKKEFLSEEQWVFQVSIETWRISFPFEDIARWIIYDDAKHSNSLLSSSYAWRLATLCTLSIMSLANDVSSIITFQAPYDRQTCS